MSGDEAASRAGQGGAFPLETGLLGTLMVPHGVGRKAASLALATRATHYATRARARARGEGARRTCRSVWQGYAGWCASIGHKPLAGDADTIAMYVCRN